MLLMVLCACLPACEPSGTVRAEASLPPSLSRATPAPSRVALEALEQHLVRGDVERTAAALMDLLADIDLSDEDLTRAADLADRLGDPNARRLALTRRLARGAQPAQPLQLELAAVQLELGDAAASAALYEQLLLDLPGTDERLALPLLESLARARTALGDHPGALAARRRALELAEDLAGPATEPSTNARVDLARSLTRLDRTEALGALIPGLPGGPRRLLLQASLGLSLARRGEHALAVARLEPAVASLSALVPAAHPELGRARLALARSRAAGGDPDQAREELLALVADLHREGGAPEALWAAQAALADLHLQADEPAQALALDRQRLASAEALLPISRPLRLDALADLCWSLHAAGETQELTRRLGELRDGTAGLLDQLAGQEPERRERLLDQADAQLALVLALDLALDATVLPTWSLLEQRHARAGAPSIRPSSAADDPALADLRRQLRASQARLDQLLAQGRREALPGAARQLAAARRAHREGLASRGLPAPEVDLAAVARALPAEGLLLSLDGVDPTPLSGRTQGPQLLAHVLTPDGRTSRHLLGSLATLEQLAAAWRDAGAPLQGPEHQALAAALVEPLAARLGQAHVWWLRSAPGLPALPLEAFAGGAAVLELADLGPVLAPRPAWDLPARLVSAVLPDLEDLPAIDGAPPAPGRSPDLPLDLSRASRDLADQLGEQVQELERRHESRGGSAQRVSGPHATRATLGRLVANVRDLLLALPVWRGASALPLSPGLTPSRSQARRPRLLGSGATRGLALSGALRGRDGLGRVTGLATLDDLARLHLLAADLVCLPTPDDDRPLLRQALHRAGARAVLMPLWPAGRQARALLLDEMLRRHWEQGLPPRQALREAQGALLAAGHAPRDVLGWRLTAGP